MGTGLDFDFTVSKSKRIGNFPRMAARIIDVGMVLWGRFIREWTALLGEEIGIIELSDAEIIVGTGYAERYEALQGVFNVQSVQAKLDSLASEIPMDAARQILLFKRYHTLNLRFLAARYAQILFEKSNGEIDVELRLLQDSKSELKSEKSCEFYPC